MMFLTSCFLCFQMESLCDCVNSKYSYTAFHSMFMCKWNWLNSKYSCTAFGVHVWVYCACVMMSTNDFVEQRCTPWILPAILLTMSKWHAGDHRHLSYCHIYFSFLILFFCFLFAINLFLVDSERPRKIQKDPERSRKVPVSS